jgi:hypothetical protein
MIDIWERFVDKEELDGTLNKDKYDSASISIEIKTIRTLQYFFIYTELQYKYTNKSYRCKIILSVKSDI